MVISCISVRKNKWFNPVGRPWGDYSWITSGKKAVPLPPAMAQKPETKALETLALQIQTPPVLVYPNPVQDFIYISNAVRCPYMLRDITGNVLLQGSIGDEIHYKLDIGNVQSGCYFLSIYENQSLKKTFKIIVQNK